jgi:putative lipoprotein
MDQERRFLAMLAAATAFRHEDGGLVLLDSTRRVLVRFARLGAGRAAIHGEPTLAARAFDCEDTRDFVLASADGPPGERAVDLIVSGRRHRVPQVRTASGTRYAAEGISVWTKGREARLELDGRVSKCVENRARSIVEDARVRGAEFRATGNEPGWVWELFGDRMVFAGRYGAERLTMPRPSRVSGPGIGEERYAAAADGRRLTVRIVARPCIDSMSGARHASTVEIELDGRAHRGCGDPLQ